MARLPPVILPHCRRRAKTVIDSCGVRVAPEDVESRRIRPGATAGSEGSAGAGGMQANLIEIGFDVIREDFPEATVDLAGAPLFSAHDELRGKIAVPAGYSWQDPRFPAFGEVAAGTGFEGFGESIRQAVGFQMRW